MGTLLSRSDPRHAPHDDDDDGIVAGEAVLGAAARARVGGARLPTRASSKRGGGVERRRGAAKEGRSKSAHPSTSETKASPRLGILPPSDATAASSDEKSTALALLRSLPAGSKSKGGPRLRGRPTQRSGGKHRSSATQRSGGMITRSPSKAAAPEHARQQTLVAAGGGYQGRMPLDPIAEGQNQQQHAVQPPKDACEASSSATGKKKKLRPAALRRNGGKATSSSSTSNAGSLAAAAAASLAADGYPVPTNENDVPDGTLKVPVDPPGAILGALPWMHPANGGQQPQPTMPSAQHGAHYYGGHPPTYQPMYPHMNGWGYQPPHQHQPMPGNAEQQHRSQHQWTMPPFLAPLAATVRHPFATFMNNGAHHDGSWAQNGGGSNQLMHMAHGAGVAQPTSHVEGNVPSSQGNAAPPSDEALDDDAMSTEESLSGDESMSGGDATQDVKEVKTTFIPSTFAPPEYVATIRARQAAAAQEAASANAAVQTRSMKKKGERRTSPRAASSKSKASAAAHQACSPIANAAKGVKLGSAKVAAVEASESNDSTAPQVLTILGKKVTMIDPVRKVFVIDLLSPETCDQIRMMADNHTREAYKKEGSDVETWRTLYTYTKMDLPVVEVKDMVKKYTDGIMHDVKKIVGVVCGMKKEAMRLRPRSWKEPHLLLYQALDGRDPHTGIEMHYDGCDITWQAMLTRLDEYEGGGTYFRALRKTVKLRQGQVLVHPGELYHKGIDITYGVRTLLVCFTDGASPNILDDSKAENDNAKYEKTVVIV